MRLTVSDTGTGMSREVAARAFEPFFTTKPKGEGTGLGLATVYGIVTQAGGDVAIYSEPGVGTTIRVDLPATSDASRGASRTPSPTSRSLANGETVLLVEDEEIVREPARRMLGGTATRCSPRPMPPRRWRIVRRAPGRDRSVAHRRRDAGTLGQGAVGSTSSSERPATKVLFMSGYSQDVIVHQGVLDEGVSLIEKPFSADDLLRKVRDVLDGGG